MYNKTIMEHFQNPRNAGDMADPDGVGTVGNPACGDVMTLYIKVENDVIIDIRFKTFGCGAAIASSSRTFPTVWADYRRSRCTAPFWPWTLSKRLS